MTTQAGCALGEGGMPSNVERSTDGARRLILIRNILLDQQCKDQTWMSSSWGLTVLQWSTQQIWQLWPLDLHQEAL